MARSGERVPVGLNEGTALNYARRAADGFVVGVSHRVAFNKELAVQDTKAKTKEE